MLALGKERRRSVDAIFQSCGMDEYSVKISFDVLDEKFGKKLKSNDDEELKVVIPEALYALAEITQH